MSWSILDVPTFRGPCSPLHQGEEQPDTELFLQVLPFYVTLLVERNIKRKDLEEQLSIRLLLALMKWTARPTKRWHIKNGPRHGENPRSTD
ncbi:hypothetical protein G5I_09725 [Acromyrmex echinatior]|uniref:Uncharacterized protein n=1 Tax=Acromyrmex echinatior TaxID=103372 RepID=F4WUZ4_ACREC|nr:hypothetical protein G5I_09725 [Acromyrmex echinatior]